MKKIISFILILAIIFSISTVAYATPETSNDQIFDSSYDYNRNCDYQTGIIIEKYDTIINGENDINYIALASSMSSEKDDRIAAMRMIVSIFDMAEEDEQIYLKSYIQSYAPYTDQEELNEFCESFKVSFPSTLASYNRQAAVDYAKKHAYNYNPAYPNLDVAWGDCANFVSQCLLAGGKAMTGDWYIYRKNNVYNTPTNVKELNYSWRLADPSPWISAKEFKNFWSDNSAATYEYSTSEYKSNHNTIFNKSIYVGDAVQILNPVLWWYEGQHTMIIVGYDSTNKDFIYAAHSGNTQNSTLINNVCNNTNYKKSHIKFYHML